MKILVFPRDSNPYQDTLYNPMLNQDHQVSYLDPHTPSATANILLLPFALTLARLRGFRILHLHWLFGFMPNWAMQSLFLRRLAERWMWFCIRVSSILGMKLVWTAHNLKPHEPLFIDDKSVNEKLCQIADGVISLNVATARELQKIPSVQEKLRVIPHGSYRGTYPDFIDRTTARESFGLDNDERVAVFFGRIEPYKGVIELLNALNCISNASQLTLIIAGRCNNESLAKQINDVAGDSQQRVILRLTHISNDEVQYIFRAADCAVLPFREIDNSGSAMLAMSFDCPILIPDFEVFNDIPQSATIRFAPNQGSSLISALEGIAEMKGSELEQLKLAARRYALSLNPNEIAQETLLAYAATFNDQLVMGACA